MSHFPTSQSSARTSRMGRPPLNVKRMVIRLSVETIARIEAVAGKRRIAEFVRAAVLAELSRHEAATSHDKPPKPAKAAKPAKAKKGSGNDEGAEARP